MKKRYLFILLSLSIILASVKLVSAESQVPYEDDNINNIVIVGYLEEDRKEIFGDMTDKQIENFLEEYSIKILENLKRKDFLKFQNLPRGIMANDIREELLFVKINETILNNNYKLNYQSEKLNKLKQLSDCNWEFYATHVFNYSIFAETSVGYITSYFTSEVDTERCKTTPPGLMDMYIYKLIDIRTYPKHGVPQRWIITGKKVEDIVGYVYFKFHDSGTYATKTVTFTANPDGKVGMR